MSGAVCLTSGGQDSTTCLFWAKQRFAPVLALAFDYGQRHRIELEAAQVVCERHCRIDFQHVISVARRFCTVYGLTVEVAPCRSVSPMTLPICKPPPEIQQNPIGQ